jgi:translocator protein
VSAARRWLPLFGFILITFAVATVGSFATSSSVGSWYAQLAKPTWNPPSSWFGPVWTLLYAFMAVVGWRLWLRRHDRLGQGLLSAWGVQLALNAAWSPAFFGLQSEIAGLLVILPLWFVLLVIQVRLWRFDRICAWLWLPYLLWVSFATALNFTIWRMN